MIVILHVRTILVIYKHSSVIYWLLVSRGRGPLHFLQLREICLTICAPLICSSQSPLFHICIHKVHLKNRLILLFIFICLYFCYLYQGRQTRQQSPFVMVALIDDRQSHYLFIYLYTYCMLTLLYHTCCIY